MSYSDHRQNRTMALGAVAVVHIALGYALLTGLAGTVIQTITAGPLETYEVPDVPPPPPEPKPLPKTTSEMVRTVDTPVVPLPEVPAPPRPDTVIVAIDLPQPTPIASATPNAPAEPAKPAVSLARGAAPRGNQGDWFPSDSYPAAAQRAGAQGLVSVRVDVGANGRVTDCTVTASSGNADLDATTCRLARRNGRFEPARDASGTAVPSTATLRNVRWQLQD